MATAEGVQYAHLTRFLWSAGYLHKIAAELRAHDGRRPPWAHVGMLCLREAGTVLVAQCGRCGAEDLLALPKPARAMLHPAGVPAGLGDQVWELRERIRVAHQDCHLESEFAKDVLTTRCRSCGVAERHPLPAVARSLDRSERERVALGIREFRARFRDAHRECKARDASQGESGE
jgi:hypothetical protein